MRDDLIKNLDRKVDRRSFLRGSGLVAATAIGVAAAGRLALAQEQQQQQQQPPQQDDSSKKNDDSSDSETKVDAQGREYRVCPQCGSNMYRQGRTWTCENCGYSYVE